MECVNIRGVDVSRFMLGTVQLGLDYGIANTAGKPSVEKAHEILQTAYDMGVTVLDTAAAYGTSEEVVGSYLKANDHNMKVISKFVFKTDDPVADLKQQIATSRQLLANPKAEICAFHNGTWVRVAGELIEDDRVEAKKSMLDAYPNLRGMYNENDGNTQVFYFRNATATFSSFSAAPETVTF